MTQKNLKAESGAIMLEVVAVLALMGMMGAALFRQMYLRNQELSNIQMAGEIRMVKDAFAEWIKVHASSNPNHFANPEDPCLWISDLDILGSIEDDYLPESADINLIDPDSPDYYLYGCRTSIGGGTPRYYGLIIPNPDTLPEDFNFRRAARVSRLIGADGGVYDSAITPGLIKGTMGTWAETAPGKIQGPYYAATTGVDIFMPEIEIPPMKAGLHEDWNVAINEAHIDSTFSVGGSKAPGEGCYEIQHTQSVQGADGETWFIQNDDLSHTNAIRCWPAFLVEQGSGSGITTDTAGHTIYTSTGNVKVLNDLSVGHDYETGTAAMRFDKNGMIVFEKAEVYDPQVSHNINYVLDPQYTSVMNDIKIMSRGGAKLSEILPNYILKEVKTLRPGSTRISSLGELPWDKNNGWKVTIPANYCPKGYHYALIAEPTKWEAKTSEFNLKYDEENDISDDTNSNTITVTYANNSNRRAVYIGPKQLCGRASITYSYGGLSTYITTNSFLGTIDPEDQNDLYICFGTYYTTNDTGTSHLNYHVSVDDEAQGNLYLYCVFDKDTFKETSISEENCKANGWSWESGSCYKVAPSGTSPQRGGRTELTTTDCAKITTQGTCELMGCTWNSGSCQ